jgi:hypothetical protein
METNECVNIFPTEPTSKRSDEIINVVIVQDKKERTCNIINGET